ncbi:hypothetical protein BDR06DRAFT_974877 [Suillus hirtellus]|nr:hypothetical protein BDR06DRAFT_974877 [Suillus hirtellus]
MSSTTPVHVTSAIRAVAFIMKEHVASEIAELAAKQITDNLTAKLVDHVVAAISPQVALIHDASQTLNATIEDSTRLHTSISRERTEKEDNVKTAADRIEEAADALYDSVETYQKALQILTPSLDATQEKIDLLHSQISKNPPEIQQAPRPTYSSVVAAQLPPMVDQAISRAAIRARQVLLDPKPGEQLFPQNTSNQDITNKLKNALTAVRNDSTPPGTIRSVSTLRNGGIIVELENETLASWFNSPNGKAAIESQLDTSVSFRQHLYTLVLEYLPTIMQIDRDGFLRDIEQENYLPDATLASIRWIKPAQKRSAGQRKAFALLLVSDIHVANNIIREGLCVESERINVRKDKKEPLRCAKCQKFNHIAKNCSSLQDVCSTCGEQHCTANCNAY